MHDPLVVAFEIHRPWPRQTSFPAAGHKSRWAIRHHHEHHQPYCDDHGCSGNPFPWWRLRSYSSFWRLAGRDYYWPPLVTIWHREPGGRDSGEVCEHYTRHQDADGKWQYRFHGRWRWHVHHWKIQIHPVQHLHRWLFERCVECGRRYPWGYAPVAHQWGEPRGRWWHVTRRAYHHECSSLVTLRHTLGQTEDVARRLAAEVRVRADESETDMLDRLNWPEFHLRYRLQTLLGYERDDEYRLVKAARV